MSIKIIYKELPERIVKIVGSDVIIINTLHREKEVLKCSQVLRKTLKF